MQQCGRIIYCKFQCENIKKAFYYWIKNSIFWALFPRKDLVVYEEISPSRIRQTNIVPPLFQHSLKTFFNYIESIDRILFSYLTLADFISVKYTCE